jgi:stalled ribosome rescue protein Dom34
VPRRKRRGYPIAILIGLEKNVGTIWNIFSESIKLDNRISKETNNYNFFETIVDRLRPNVKKGIKTVLITSTDKKNFQEFLDHIKKHQKWLVSGYDLNQITIEYIEGSARDFDDVQILIEKSALKKTVKKASQAENNRVLKALEKRLGTPEGINSLIFSLKEVENGLYNDKSIEIILMTTKFKDNHKRRTQRILQIAQNKGIKSMIIENNTPMEKRLTQFGGLIGIRT